MASIPRPLPKILKAFIAEVEQVVASSDDRRDTIVQLTPSFATLLADPTWLRSISAQPVAESSSSMLFIVPKTPRYRSWPWWSPPAWPRPSMIIAPGDW